MNVCAWQPFKSNSRSNRLIPTQRLRLQALLDNLDTICRPFPTTVRVSKNEHHYNCAQVRVFHPGQLFVAQVELAMPRCCFQKLKDQSGHVARLSLDLTAYGSAHSTATASLVMPATEGVAEQSTLCKHGRRLQSVSTMPRSPVLSGESKQAFLQLIYDFGTGGH